MNMIIRRINKFAVNVELNCQFIAFPGKTDQIERIKKEERITNLNGHFLLY